MDENEIVKLLEQIKNGDERAFAEFYSQTYKYVYSRAKCMFSDEQEVQDLVQEVYLAVYRNIGSLEVNESIFAWLRTTTFYQGTKMLKKKRKEVLLSEEGEGMFETIPDDEPEIEEDYMNKEDVEVIRECINRLSDEQKTVLLAYYYDNMKVNEIAEVLSLSAGTIKSRLYLARKNLQVHIEEEEKKRGYKLHSFGAVTVALALRMFLQGNMEVAGSIEETIFAKVCQGLNFEVSKTVAAQSGIAEQVAQEGTKQAGKGILGKLGALGAKKVAISAVGIIAAVALGGVAIGGMNEDAYKSKSEGTSQQVSENRELQQWQIDYARVMFELISMPGEVKNVTMADTLFQEDLTKYLKEYHCFLNDPDMQEMGSEMFFGLHNSDTDEEPELYVEFKDAKGKSKSIYMFQKGDNIADCYRGKVIKDVKVETHLATVDDVLELLNVSISHEDKTFLNGVEFFVDHYMLNTEEVSGNYDGVKVSAIMLGDDKEYDYAFIKEGFFEILTSEGDMFFDIVDLSKESLSFAEKQGKIFECYDGENFELLRVYGMFDDGICKVEHDIRKNYISNSNGTVEVKCEYREYTYTGDDEECAVTEQREITEAEYLNMYNGYCKNAISLLDGVTYTNVVERLYEIEISLAK